MSYPQKLHAYDDCIDLFERALQSKTGIWLQANDPGQATNIRARLHYCRKLLRDQSMEIHSEGDPEYGVSPYENLYVTIQGSTLYIRHRKTNDLPTGEIADEASP